MELGRMRRNCSKIERVTRVCIHIGEFDNDFCSRLSQSPVACKSAVAQELAAVAALQQEENYHNVFR